MVYKLVFDVKEVDLNKLFKAFETQGLDFCFADECVYIHDPRESAHQFSTISDIMREVNNDNYFLQKITNRPSSDCVKNFANIWIMEKIDEDDLRKFESKRQKELREMQKNIQSAEDQIRELIKTYKEGAAKNAGG